MTSWQSVYMSLRCTMALLSDRWSSKRPKASLIDYGTLNVTACNRPQAAPQHWRRNCSERFPARIRLMFDQLVTALGGD